MNKVFTIFPLLSLKQSIEIIPHIIDQPLHGFWIDSIRINWQKGIDISESSIRNQRESSVAGFRCDILIEAPAASKVAVFLVDDNYEIVREVFCASGLGYDYSEKGVNLHSSRYDKFKIKVTPNE